jgi:hypothetical protein
MWCVIGRRLKGVDLGLKGWHKEEYGDPEENVRRLVEEIIELNCKGEYVWLEEFEIQTRKSKFGELWRNLKARDSILAQRSRLKWIKEGDANSKYIHNCIKRRTSRNVIKALKVGERWVKSTLEVRREVVDFFTRHVESIAWERPKLDGVHFHSVTEEQHMGLVCPFEASEIEEVVKGIEE